MKYSTDITKINNVIESVYVDAIADKNDAIQVEFMKQSTGLMLYIHVNGVTVLRMGQINPSILEIDIPKGITVYEV